MKTKEVDMLSGSVTKGLMTLTIPIMIMNVGQLLFNVIDMTVLKTFSSDSAVGSVGACSALITLCTSLLIGMSVGANIVVAKRLGMKNREHVIKTAETAIALSVIGGLILMLIGAVFAKTFLEMTNCPSKLLPQATVYFRIYFYAVPFLMLYNFCSAILRAAGDTKSPMYLLILGGIIKGVFTLLFVAAFNMSVEGVAIATIISNLVIALIAFRIVTKNKSVSVEIKKIKLYSQELKEMLFIGIPSGLQTAMYSLANVVITTAVNRLGPYATTGMAIANQFDGILYQIIYAPSFAVVPYVAQNIGAGNIKRMKRAVLSSVFIATAFGVVFGSFFAVFSRQLSSIMSDTPAVIRFSQQKMVIVSSTYFLCGINAIMGGVLQGMGKPIVPAVATFVYMCLFRFLWVYIIFPLYPTLTFLYLVWPIGWLLSIITELVFYFPTSSKLQSKLLHTSKMA